MSVIELDKPLHLVVAPERTGRDILMLAADVIEKRGLCRGTLEDGRGRVCSLGAINVAASGIPWIDVVEDPLAAKAKEILEKHVGDIPIDFWNDTIVPVGLFGRPKRYVARKMREAARCG